ncbi:acetoacetate--CoA ligase [Paraburkholderia phymatum]|uniref:Acetoacetyl-CoA synthase n=1 Tax=Paraburkholderia phymatum (strain DSM 17167 / CIP 108236 / LMG 21445 / STM815) TaxID=391038 RepID=B2JTV6_PARP8|nr:acetoacetate--CoA ligase [Paraburkholderia phymatum]ACC76009.1 acetoacetyl-CoA synthase [Paraburkholderia phymatum STM815]
MNRLYLPDATQCRRVDAGRIRVCNDQCARPATSQLATFTAALQARTGEVIDDYQSLHDFSVRDYRTFWRCFVEWSKGLEMSGRIEPVCVGDECEHACFFPRAQLNYSANLLNLSVAPANAPALTACHADGRRVHLSRGELRERVARLAHSLSKLGLRDGDRAVAVMRNDADAAVTALAVTALGATFASAAPEMGVEAMLDRFAPLGPRLLFAHTAACDFDTGMPLATKVGQLASALPTLQGLVCLDERNGLLDTVSQPVYSIGELINAGDASSFRWPRFSFNHPLFIMFSSGTTGKPKCIVHGAGGSLLEHLKEHRLHSDLRPGDRMYFHTTCAWMMWNWQLSALASGVEIVTYDGPISTIDVLWRLVANERVTVFGTSPAYLKMCEDADLAPGLQFDLGALRTIMSTGAVLYDTQFDWVRDHVKPLLLQSISGGTDILGCFVLGNPDLPVRAGEAQCKSLALDVQAWDQGARTTGIGELVCINPFPSRPLGFYGDTDGAAFHAAYFSRHPGVWTHGDLIEFSPEGTARLHGRSDGILNVRGIKIAPAEIYRVLNDIREIREAMAVEQGPSDGLADSCTQTRDKRIVLLLVLQDGASLDGRLLARIRHDLAHRASPAHVPDRVIAVEALPVTHSGKLSERAACNAVNGLPLANVAALRNPECLDAIRTHPGLRPATRTLPPPGGSREQLECHLQALWERLFGFAPVARDDNFFELGGNSLLAARLLADVQQSTGHRMPIATLLIAPTISRLAGIIRDGAPQPMSPILVPVCAGTGTPLFLVHGLSGSVMECWALVQALRSPRPVFGLQARGIDGGETAQQRIEDMAACYIDQMRTVQPDGPYSVTGYSLGGLIAFEIAQQLRRAGDQVELLCLLDPYVYERWLPWSARMHHWYGRIRGQWRKLRTVPAPRVIAYLADRLIVGADHVQMRFGHKRLRPDATTAAFPPALRQVRETLALSMTRYRPLPYDAGPILYVRATSRLDEHGDPMLLWRRVARGGLAIVEVPGSHDDLVVEPNLRIVAALLDNALANTRDRGVSACAMSSRHESHKTRGSFTA